MLLDDFKNYIHVPGGRFHSKFRLKKLVRQPSFPASVRQAEDLRTGGRSYPGLRLGMVNGRLGMGSGVEFGSNVTARLVPSLR